MNNKGYSLYELLLVIGLIIIISGIVKINAFGFLGHKNVEAITKQLNADIMFAQQKAIEESRNWVIHFDSHEYTIFPSSNPTAISKTVSLLNSKVSFGDNNNNFLPENDIIFTALGAPLNGETIIALKNNKGNSRYLKIFAVTGRTKITKEP